MKKTIISSFEETPKLVAYYVPPIDSEMLSKLASELILMDLSEWKEGATANLVIMDISQDNSNLVLLSRRITNVSPNLLVFAANKYLVLKYRNQLLMAGVRGFLTTQCSSETLRDAILAVSKGNTYIDPDPEL